jgi:hypothetical protein
MKSSGLTWCAAIAAVSSLAASAGQTVPRLKPGLWAMQVHSSAGGDNTALPSTVCIGAMPEQQWRLEEENARNRCSKFESREVAGEWVIDAVCSARSRTITKHAVTSLSGKSFREEDTAAQGSMTSEGKRLGPCKPGQMPDVYR